MSKIKKENFSLEYLRGSLVKRGLDFDTKSITPEIIIQTLGNEAVLYAWLSSIRKELELKSFIEKHGAQKEQSEKHKVLGVKIIDESFSTLSGGSSSGIH